MSCIIFAAKHLNREEVAGKRLIEVGSYDVNGSVRPLLSHWKPAEYLGVDIKNGPGVDVVCNAEDIVKKFGAETFDIVISTELMEHVKDWRRVISNFKNICRTNGFILITTRSYGYPVHSYPYDYWRYEPEDLKEIFSDCDMIALERDFEAPGVFMKVRKPLEFSEKDLSKFQLYSMFAGKRIQELTGSELQGINFVMLAIKGSLRNFLYQAYRWMQSRI
jgi:SAM-dependent methyltransferase